MYAFRSGPSFGLLEPIPYAPYGAWDYKGLRVVRVFRQEVYLELVRHPLSASLYRERTIFIDRAARISREGTRDRPLVAQSGHTPKPYVA